MTTGADTASEAIVAVDACADNARQIEEEYLRKSGWEHTCDVPGSYWVWRKHTDRWGTLMSARPSIALRYQFFIEDLSDAD